MTAQPAEPAPTWTYVFDEATGQRIPVADRAAFLAQLEAQNRAAEEAKAPATPAPTEEQGQ